jgi:U3 small nucleolar RNA-associated protein 10
MSTSLKEQLLRLQTPQSSLFVDSKRRDSILFSPKEAATKSRETIYEIGLSGLQELIDMDASFAEFENTLFNFTARDVQRAVETSEVNKLLNKNIKRFMFHLSPYFMIPSSHKCLEWLIRRFNINLYNKEEMLMLILPYHQTNMFVRCVQTMKFNDPSDKWSFLAEVKKSCSPLSKLTLWNHGASQPAFLDFVGRFTYEATKELSHSAGKLQTMFSFYFTSCVGSLEHASVINDNHILAVSKYLIKTYNSAIVDFTAAGYMITAQLVAKVSLAPKLLYELMDKLTKNINVKLSRDCFLLLALIFQTQSEELRVTDKVLENLLNFTKLLAVLKQVKDEDKIITEFYKALIYKILKKLQDKDENFEGYSDVCEKLLNEIDMDDELAQVIIR